MSKSKSSNPGRLKWAACHFDGDRHPDRGRDSLAERPGGRLDPRGPAVLGVAGGLRVELAKRLDVLERDRQASVDLVVGIDRPHPGEVQQRVEQHRGVPGREHEAVAVRPDRLGRDRSAGSAARGCRRPGASAIGVPGWPEFAFWIASIDRVRIVLIAELVDLVEGLALRGLKHPSDAARGGVAGLRTGCGYNPKFVPRRGRREAGRRRGGGRARRRRDDRRPRDRLDRRLPAPGARRARPRRCAASRPRRRPRSRRASSASRSSRSTRSTASTSRSTAPTRSRPTAGWSRAAAAPTRARRSSPRRPSASS